MDAEPGATVVLRDLYWGAVWFAWPLAVEADDERGLLAWQLPGSTGRVPAGYPQDRDQVLRQLGARTVTLEPLTWKHTLGLHVLVPGQWWTARLMWREVDGEFLCWYVDLRLPLQRHGVLVDSRDLQLDLVVGPDRRWSWKDEDDLALFGELGVIDGASRAHIEAARDDIIDAVERRAFPFDDALVEARPPSVNAPALPRGWDAV